MTTYGWSVRLASCSTTRSTALPSPTTSARCTPWASRRRPRRWRWVSARQTVVSSGAGASASRATAGGESSPVSTRTTARSPSRVSQSCRAVSAPRLSPSQRRPYRRWAARTASHIRVAVAVASPVWGSPARWKQSATGRAIPAVSTVSATGPYQPDLSRSPFRLPPRPPRPPRRACRPGTVSLPPLLAPGPAGLPTSDTNAASRRMNPPRYAEPPQRTETSPGVRGCADHPDLKSYEHSVCPSVHFTMRSAESVEGVVRRCAYFAGDSPRNIPSGRHRPPRPPRGDRRRTGDPPGRPGRGPGLTLTQAAGSEDAGMDESTAPSTPQQPRTVVVTGAGTRYRPGHCTGLAARAAHMYWPSGAARSRSARPLRSPAPVPSPRTRPTSPRRTRPTGSWLPRWS